MYTSVYTQLVQQINFLSTKLKVTGIFWTYEI